MPKTPLKFWAAIGHNKGMAGKRLITAGEAARLVGMTPKQFARWTKRLPSIREGAGWRYFFAEDVQNFRQFVEPAPQVEIPAPPKGRKAGKGFWD